MPGRTASHETESPDKNVRDGIISAFIAYFFWGVFPVYFVWVKDVPPNEVLAHRIIWAVPFGALIIHMRGQWTEVGRALRHRRTVGFLVLSAILITGNWLAYIWAVQLEQIRQASLGYYINPLLFALAGVVVFGERLRKAQTAAVILAATGVGVLTFSGGEFPAIALFLGVTFAVYGVIRKQVVVGGMPGLFIETLVVLPFALGYLLWLSLSGNAAFSPGNPSLAAVLVLAGPFTVIPLLFFALAARRLKLSTVGMLQFIAPTLQFVIAVIYGEELTAAHVICFSLIWIAVVLFVADVWRTSRAIAAIAPK